MKTFLITLLLGLVALPFYGTTYLFYYTCEKNVAGNCFKSDMEGFHKWLKDRYVNMESHELTSLSYNYFVDAFYKVGEEKSRIFREDTIYFAYVGPIQNNAFYLNDRSEGDSVKLSKVADILHTLNAKVAGMFIFPFFDTTNDQITFKTPSDSKVFFVSGTPQPYPLYKYKQGDNQHSNFYNAFIATVLKDGDKNKDGQVTLGELNKTLDEKLNKYGINSRCSYGGVNSSIVVGRDLEVEKEWTSKDTRDFWIILGIIIFIIAGIFSGRERTYKVTVREW